MGKKRIIKKRIQKKKQVKKELKKQKPDVSNMSRLEYEQAMMDPRFRAAMMGFNNPGGNAQIAQMNNSLREQENKNNELTRQITIQQELSNMKQENIKLKGDLNETKRRNDEEVNKMKWQMENQKLQNTLNGFNMKIEHQKEVVGLQAQIDARRQEIEIEKVKHEEEQKRWKQKQELLKQYTSY